MSRHINADLNQIAPLILIAGDPLRTEHMAKKFLKDPKLVSKVRNNYVYTGTYQNIRISFATSGMGNASIAIYAHELINDYHAKAIIRVGSCGAYDDKLQIKDVLLVNQAYSPFIFWPELGSNSYYLPADSALNQIITQQANALKLKIQTVNCFSTSNFYELNSDRIFQWALKNNLSAVEMESYALFAQGIKFKCATATILTVSDLLFPPKDYHKVQATSFKERRIEFESMFKIGLESLIVFAKKLST